MIKIPKKLKIGGLCYSILRHKMEDCGSQDTKKQTIEISNDLSPELEELTFWHEVLHAVNINLTEKETEYLAQAITQIIIDNKLYGNIKKCK